MVSDAKEPIFNQIHDLVKKDIKNSMKKKKLQHRAQLQKSIEKKDKEK